MRYKVVIICLLLLGLAIDFYALPSKCLQASERIDVCPHLIYKKSALSVALLDVHKGGVICICLSDFKALNNLVVSKVEQIEQNISPIPIAEKYQLSE